MEFKLFTCGDDDGPVATETIFKSSFLKTCLVSHIQVNNDNENHQDPSPDFVHSYVNGTIDRNPNVWKTGDKLTVFYQPCKCD